MTPEPTRPRSVSAMRERLERLHSPAALAAARAFVPRPDDVFIITYPKSGTTWMQQIVHGLRTGGDMSFDEICEVVPWLETCVDLGIDPNAEQPGGLRAFKTHASATDVPPGARYLVVVRDPAHVLLSFHRFFEGWMFEPGAIDLQTFFDELFVQGSNSGRYWEHLAGWWARRDEPQVLMLAYEDLVDDLPRAVDRLVAWLGLDVDERTRAMVVRQSSFEFMQAHARQFDDHLLRDARNAACGLPPGGIRGKTGRGPGAARRVSEGIRRRLDELWAQVVTPATGCADYAALRRTLR